MRKEVMIDASKCNGCLSCTVACSAAHIPSGDPLEALLTGEPSRIAVYSVHGKAVPITCRHCDEPACVNACMAGAMQKNAESGRVKNENTGHDCIGCWMCVMACPYGVINQREKEGRSVAVKCDGCVGRSVPACVESCPNGALTYGPVNEYAETKQRQAAASQVA
ncbi:4Fe-4S dicluster domain-containing protein [Heliorestis acidaminivorans]|uniref:4Fe-4S dicluster domain-containing protein n=1 Tax=Heliorestis acidaminivorans TaxID=553427 RepID=A0A6I0F2W7_9FIRM|nr:4Fe-4S dicluster domain-containing protein [Heliorestis acidaminivorans]KAB2953900.1 4Fe-4S dicluster domain-containing protein [Heliorestis acidaminivorans]